MSDTSAITETAERTVPRRRIDEGDLRRLAELVSRRLTTSEACRRLNISPQTFFSWQSRHRNSERFEALVEEFRAIKIDTAMLEIEQAGKIDWRASDRYLAFLDSQRFNDRRGVDLSVNLVAISPQAMKMAERALAIVYGCPEPKRIESDSTNQTEHEQPKQKEA